MSKQAKRHRSHSERKGQRKMQTRKGSHPTPGYKISDPRPGFFWYEGFDTDPAGTWIARYLPEPASFAKHGGCAA